MVRFIESKIEPNLKEYVYWVDLKEDPYGAVIKYYNGSTWVNISKDAQQNLDITQIKEQLKNKVDKVDGKLLSTNDYTNEEKKKLASLNNYNDTEIKNQLNTKVDKVNGKLLSTNDYTTAEKEKLASLSNYNDAELKKQLGNKVDKVEGKGLSANDYTSAEKTKLSGIAEKANNYVHPTTAGNKHIPAGGSANQLLRWKADGEAQWANEVKIVVNNTLTSTSVTEALSAALGKVLKEALDLLNQRVSNLENPKP